MYSIRAASHDDLASCHDVWLSTEDGYGRDFGPGGGHVLPLHEHELRSGTLLVAVDARDGVVGFGATFVRSGVSYLADLFVRPEAQGKGIGRMLLDGLFAHFDGPRFTMASAHPAARSLYEAFGMLPAWTLAYLGADPAKVDREQLRVTDVDVVEVAATDTRVLEIDRTVTGRDRAIDLEHSEAHLGARTLLVVGSGNVIGYGAVASPIWWNPWNPNGTRIGPVCTIEPTDAFAATAAVVAFALDLGAATLGPFVPESNAALAPLLRAGLTVTDSDLYMTSNPSLVDADRYCPAIDTV